MIQYSEASMMESRSRGVRDTRFRGYDGLLWRSAVHRSSSFWNASSLAMTELAV
jgi:hypothetical protein